MGLRRLDMNSPVPDGHRTSTRRSWEGSTGFRIKSSLSTHARQRQSILCSANVTRLVLLWCCCHALIA